MDKDTEDKLQAFSGFSSLMETYFNIVGYTKRDTVKVYSTPIRCGRPYEMGSP